MYWFHFLTIHLLPCISHITESGEWIFSIYKTFELIFEKYQCHYFLICQSYNCRSDINVSMAITTKKYLWDTPWFDIRFWWSELFNISNSTTLVINVTSTKTPRSPTVLYISHLCKAWSGKWTLRDSHNFINYWCVIFEK